MRKFTLVALLAAAAMLTSGRTRAQCNGNVSISTTFDSVAIDGYLWFNSSVRVTGITTYPLTIYFTNQTVASSEFNVQIPDGELILDSSYTSASTHFNGSIWVTTAPPNLSGYYFISGANYLPMFNPDLPGQLDGRLRTTWSGTFTTSRPGVSLAWHWAAAQHGVVMSTSSITPVDGTLPAGSPILSRVFSGPGATTGSPDHPGGHFTTEDSLTVCQADPTVVLIGASLTSAIVPTNCAGTSITFSATVINGGTSPSWQWKKNGVNVGTNSSTYTASGIRNNDVITVALTSTGPSGSSSTVVSDSIIANVITAPDPLTILGGRVVCVGDTLHLTASSDSGRWTSYNDHTWISRNTAVATVSASGAVTAVSAGSAAIYLWAMNGCGQAAVQTTVVAVPAVHIIGTVTPPTCSGYTDGSIVTYIDAGGTSGYVFKWSDSSTGGYGDWGVGAGTYTVTATTIGCKATAVFTVPDGSGTTAASISGDSSLCVGGSLTLTASPAGGVWSSSNMAIGTVSGSGTLTGVSSGTATISYAVTGSCGSGVATKTVHVAEGGFTLSGATTSPTCNGYTNGSVVTSVSPRRGHTYTYVWDNGAASTGLWGVPAGTYSVTATNETGCKETQAFTVTQPAPLASTYSVTDDYAYGGTHNGAVYYGLSGGTWPYTYSWSNGATTQNITGLSAGTYVVTATDANSCTITNWFSVHETNGSGRMVSSTGHYADAGSGASPNPFSSQTTITFSTPENCKATVDIYSAVTGDKVATIFNDDIHAGQEYSCKLSGDKLASGVYLYKITSGDKNLYTGKVVLVK